MPSQLRNHKRDATKDQDRVCDPHSVASQSAGQSRERSSESASASASDEDEDEEESDDNEDDDDDEAGEAEEDEDDSPFKILERLDPKLLGPGFDPAWLTRKPNQTTSRPEVTTEQRGGDHDERSSSAGTDDAEFYGAMIQMLTHVLGSSDTVAWPNQPTPGSQLAPSPFGHAYSSPAQTPNQAAASLSVSKRSAANNRKSELTALQPLIQALISRLGKDQQPPRRPVGEQDLTALLQTLMEQQQRQQGEQASASHPASNYAFHPQSHTVRMPSSRNDDHTAQQLNAGLQYDGSAPSSYQTLHFADLDFEDEDEDDPDFNPDLNPDLPLPSAWSLAVRDVVASEQSRAAAAAVAASHSGTPSGVQTPADAIRTDAFRAGNSYSSARSPPHTSSSNNATRRTSLPERAAHTCRQDPSERPTTSNFVIGGDGVADPSWTSSRHPTAPISASSGSHRESLDASELLFSPSGRPIRTSRKRQGSPTPNDPTRHHSRKQGRAGLESDNIRERDRAESGYHESPSSFPRNDSTSDIEAMTASAPPQAQTDAGTNLPRKRGRKPVLEPGEAQRRRAQRNIEYQRMRRQVKKAEESEQSETVLELRAEVKMLRAEMERLRDENATLRAQRELDRLQRNGGHR